MHFVEYFHLLPKYLETKLTLKPQSLLTIVHSFSVQTLTFFLVSLLSILLALRLQQTESALSDSLKDFKNLTELYKQIFNNISTGIITIDPQLIITSANQSSQNILGMTSSQLIQKKISDILPNINLTQMHTRLALSYSSPAGQQLRIGYSHMLLPRSEHEIPNDNGVNHRILTLQDITEVEKLEAQVRQSEKLAAIGTMSASIAHDFRNPLTAINGSAQILISEIANSKELDKSNYELCNIILRESTRLTDTISDFLKFSRPEIAKCSWFSLRNCVNEVIEVCRAAPQWPSTCEISIEIEKNLDIWADQNQLFVIFDHLIDNALSFCPKGNEKLEIIAQETTLSGETFIEIIFRDNGPGIPSEQRAKILEPFHTTRADGTGLGLSIIRQNMKEHKGSIQIGNSENGGAEFKLLFPIPDY